MLLQKLRMIATYIHSSGDKVEEISVIKKFLQATPKIYADCYLHRATRRPQEHVG